jgi:hypothetical protein
VIRRDTRLDDLLSEAAKHLSVARSRGGNQAIFADSLDEEIESVVADTAGNAALSAEAIMEIVSVDSMTEIEIGAPPELDQDGHPAEELPATECRETPDIAPAPGKFAGPVCDSPRTAEPLTLVERSPGITDSADRPAVQQRDVPQGKAVFAYNDVDREFEETIVITAPFDVHSTEDSDVEAESGSRDASTRATSGKSTDAPATTTEKATADTADNDEAGTGDQDKPEESPRRTGLIRRLFAAVFPPFRKHRKT